jgi:hypothetical protein
VKIHSKEEFSHLQSVGLCGNHFRSWATVEDALNAQPQPEYIYIRGPRPGWKWMTPQCPIWKLEDRVTRIESESGDPRTNYRFFEVLPLGTPRYLNAEAGWMPHGFEMRFGLSSDLCLREDLQRNGTIWTGLKALHFMKSRVPPEDTEMLYEIWDLFPGAIIELSVYGRPCGLLARQTIVWEVRDY